MAEATSAQSKVLRVIGAQGMFLPSSSSCSLLIHSIRQPKKQSSGQPHKVCFACGKSDHFIGTRSYPAKDAQRGSWVGLGHFTCKCMKVGGTPTPTSQRSFGSTCGGES